MEQIDCVLCGPGRVRRVLESSGFVLVRCASCGLRFVSPRPTREEIGRYYPRGYSAHVEVDEAKRSRVRSRRSTRFREFERRRPGRVLDVGCGSGYELIPLMDRGWEAYGVEPDPEAAREAEKLGVRVFCGGAERAEFGAVRFDVVVMNHSLEHLHDPVAALGNLGRRLAPGGRLHLAIPHIESVTFAMFRENWAHLDLPRHLYFFDRRTLAAAAAKASLRVVRFTFNSGIRGFRRSFEPRRAPFAPRLPLYRTALRMANYFAGDGLRAGDIMKAELAPTNPTSNPTSNPT